MVDSAIGSGISFLGITLTSQIWLYVVLAFGVIAIMGIAMFAMKNNRNPYAFSYIKLPGGKVIATNKSVREVAMYEVKRVQNIPIPTYRGAALKGNRGFYFPMTDMIYEIPEAFFVDAYDTQKLFFRQIGKVGILPLMLRFKNFNKQAVEAYEKAENAYHDNITKLVKEGVKKADLPPFVVPDDIQDELVISGIADREAIILSDVHISSCYSRLKDIDSKTMTGLEEMIMKNAPLIAIAITAFLCLLMFGYFATSMMGELAKTCGGGALISPVPSAPSIPTTLP